MQVCNSLQTDNYASTPPLSFLQAGCPSCRPTNSVKALKAHLEKGILQKENVLYELISYVIVHFFWLRLGHGEFDGAV